MSGFCSTRFKRKYMGATLNVKNHFQRKHITQLFSKLKKKKKKNPLTLVYISGTGFPYEQSLAIGECNHTGSAKL